LIDKIAEYFTEKPEVAAVYLFGSYARGREKQGSDVDLGILLDRDVSSGENELRTTYLTDLARILRKDLHIVMMKDAGGNNRSDLQGREMRFSEKSLESCTLQNRRVFHDSGIRIPESQPVADH
jgi:predicted nucleotidyltransferase